ncbi:MAG: YceI family protein, partial [Variovorax sp.]
MKKLLLAAALSAAVFTGATAQQQSEFAPAAAAKPAGGPTKNASYVIDPTHTFVMYEMGHYGT